MPGFWKRPTTRMYSYNLDVGEHYYRPMTDYLTFSRGVRGSSPGALTYSERLARNWLYGRSYGAMDLRSRYVRSQSIPPLESCGISSSYLARRAESRARSESREFSSRSSAMNYERARTPPFDPAVDPLNVSAFARYKQTLLDSANALKGESERRQLDAMSRRSAEVSAEAISARQASRAFRESQAVVEASKAAAAASRTSRTSRVIQRQQTDESLQARSQSVVTETRRRIDDDILKKVADVHLMPWAAGQELDEANSASARARARIATLERELEDITRKALSTTSTQVRSAKQMAQQAMAEEEAMAASSKKTRKVMIESSARMSAAR